MVLRSKRVDYFDYLWETDRKSTKERRSLFFLFLMELLRESYSKHWYNVSSIHGVLIGRFLWAPGLLHLLCECGSWLTSFISSQCCFFLYIDLSF